MRINTNPLSLFSQFQLKKGEEKMTASLARLSSGQRINRAADDASGMVIADSLESQLRGIGQTIRNYNDSISMVQIADSALGEATSIMQDIRVKALQAGQDGQSYSSRQALQADIDRSLTSLQDIVDTTSYNGQKLLGGSLADVHFNASSGQGETSPAQGTVPAGETVFDIDVTSQEGAGQALAIVDGALANTNRIRSDLGSYQNQLASAIENLQVTQVNVASAQSLVRDVDFAEEIMVFNKSKVLNEARIFALNQTGRMNRENILALLQGR